MSTAASNSSTSLNLRSRNSVTSLQNYSSSRKKNLSTSANQAASISKSPHNPRKPYLSIERILGLNVTRPAALAIHPEFQGDSPLLAYPAGCYTVLYNHKRNKQVGFLLAGTQSSQLVNGSMVGVGGSSSSAWKTTSCVAFSPDGEVLAVGESGHQPRILIWDHKRNTIITELRGHKFGVYALAFSPNSRYLVSLGFQHDGHIFVWNWKTGVKVSTNRITVKVNALTFDDQGTFFVTVGLRHIKFWYFDTNSPLQKSKVIEGRFGIMNEHKDSLFMDVASKKSENYDSAPFYSETDSEISHPSNSYTYTITDKGILMMFGEGRVMEKWVELKVNGGASLDVTDKFIVCGCTDGTIRLFEPVSLQYITTILKPHSLGVDIALSTGISYPTDTSTSAKYPDVVTVKADSRSERIICVYSDKSMYIWDVRDPYRTLPAPSSSPTGERKRSYDQEFSNDQTSPPLPPNTFITYSSDGTARFWNFEDNLPDQEQKYFPRNIYSKELLKIVYVDPQGIISGKVFSTDSEESKSELSTNTNMQLAGQPERNGIKSLKVSPDGKFMATGDRSGNLRIHDMENFQEIDCLEAHEAEILAIDFAGKEDSSNRPWLMATSSRDRLIHVFDIRRTQNSKGKELKFDLIQTLDDHSSTVTSVRFAEGGRKLISCAADKSVIFRSVTEGGILEYTTYHFAANRSSVYDLELDPSHRYAVCASQDRRLNVYSVPTGKQIRSFKDDTPDGTQGNGGLLKVAIDPSGSLAAAASADKCIRLFDMYTGMLLSRVAGHSELVTSVKFMADGSRLISTSGDGCVIVWNLVISSQKPRNGGTLLSPMSAPTQKPISSELDDENIPFSEHFPNFNSFNEDNMADGLMKDSVIEDNIPKYHEAFISTNVPAWVKPSNLTVTKESVSDDLVTDKLISMGFQVPTGGFWGERIQSSGVQLYSEIPNVTPIAKLEDLFDRRFSLELGSPESSPEIDSSATEKRIEINSVTIFHAELKVEELDDVEDLVGTPESNGFLDLGIEANSIVIEHNEEVEDDIVMVNAGSNDDVGKDYEVDDTIFVDPSKFEQTPDLNLTPSKSLIPPLENKASDDVSHHRRQMSNMQDDDDKSELPKVAAIESETEIQEAHQHDTDRESIISSASETSNKDILCENEDEVVFEKKEFGGKMSFDDYIQRPIVLSPGTRQSLTAKHLVTRSTTPRSVKSMDDVTVEVESKPTRSFFGKLRKDKQQREKTLLEVESVRQKLVSMGISWKPSININGIEGGVKNEDHEFSEIDSAGDTSAVEETTPTVRRIMTRSQSRLNEEAKRAAAEEVYKSPSPIRKTVPKVSSAVEDIVDATSPGLMKDLETLRILAERTSVRLSRIISGNETTSSQKSSEDIRDTLSHVRGLIAGVLDSPESSSSQSSEKRMNDQVVLALEEYSDMLVQMVRMKLEQS
ncbi:hypothetical protein HK098_006767 [Nowakowskiella sp. JEL0407]|nr:hypothetical protein HK098_006767 [Nowakowskiella sp. JEL0407]